MQLSAILIEGGRGAILSTKGNNGHVAGLQLLPFVFTSKDIAERFLCACERTGVNLWPGMSHDDLKKLFALWYDSYKRPDGPRHTNRDDSEDALASDPHRGIA